jgi:hypothetical protein
MSGIAVPIAIVLVGALIIFGVTKMLSSGKNHRDLIDEMNSKTFGNRWVAAYELSKFLAAQKTQPAWAEPENSASLAAALKACYASGKHLPTWDMSAFDIARALGQIQGLYKELGA